MLPPFNFVSDENIPKDTLYLIRMRYKMIQVNDGEPPEFREKIDWDATAKASAVIKNIGEANG